VKKNAVYQIRSQFRSKGMNSRSDTDSGLDVCTADCFHMATDHMHRTLQLYSTRVIVTQWV